MRAGLLFGLALGVCVATATAAEAYSFPNRVPGGAIPDDPPKPLAGWRLGVAMTFPYTAAASVAYWWPSEAPVTYKAGATWGILDGQGPCVGGVANGRPARPLSGVAEIVEAGRVRLVLEGERGLDRFLGRLRQGP